MDMWGVSRWWRLSTLAAGLLAHFRRGPIERFNDALSKADTRPLDQTWTIRRGDTVIPPNSAGASVMLRNDQDEPLGAP